MKQAYYIFSSGTLSRRDNSITLYSDEEIKKDIPVETIDELYIFSNINYNSQLFEFLSKNNIPVYMYNHYNYYIGSFYPKESKVSGQLLVKQVEKYLDEQNRLFIAQSFIEAASYNILRNLKYYNTRGKDLTEYINCIVELRIKIFETKSITELMGIEGNIRKKYYESWQIIINGDYEFEKRVKRPPDNVINSLISLLNSLVYTKTLTEIYKTQLNPTISYLHEPGVKRFSLSLDVSEVFKPLIVDRTIFSLLNKGIITDNDFTKGNYIHLKEASLKKVISELEKTLSRTINHRTLKREVSYRYLIRLELYKLIKHLLDEKQYEGFKIWW